MSSASAPKSARRDTDRSGVIAGHQSREGSSRAARAARALDPEPLRRGRPDHLPGGDRPSHRIRATAPSRAPADLEHPACSGASAHRSRRGHGRSRARGATGPRPRSAPRTPARAGKRPRVDHPQRRPRAVIRVEQRRHGLGPSPHGSPTSARGPGRHPPNASASCRTAAANASRITTPTRPDASSHPVNCSDGGAVHSNTPGAVTIEQPSVERAFVRSATPGFRKGRRRDRFEHAGEGG